MHRSWGEVKARILAAAFFLAANRAVRILQQNALAGGVTISLPRDKHGKSYSKCELAIELLDQNSRSEEGDE